MTPTRVLILAHSFVHRLGEFLRAKYDAASLYNFNLSDDLLIRWHGIGGGMVAKTTAYDLGIV